MWKYSCGFITSPLDLWGKKQIPSRKGVLFLLRAHSAHIPVICYIRFLFLDKAMFRIRHIDSLQRKEYLLQLKGRRLGISFVDIRKEFWMLSWVICEQEQLIKVPPLAAHKFPEPECASTDVVLSCYRCCLISNMHILFARFCSFLATIPWTIRMLYSYTFENAKRCVSLTNIYGKQQSYYLLHTIEIKIF